MPTMRSVIDGLKSLLLSRENQGVMPPAQVAPAASEPAPTPPPAPEPPPAPASPAQPPPAPPPESSPEPAETPATLQERVEQEVAALLAEGKTVEALRIARQARAESPATPGLAYWYGQTLERVGRNEEALTVYREELAANPGQAPAQARCDYLEKALAEPVFARVPAEQRSYRTSLPHELLMSIQKAHHNYRYRGVPLLKNPFDFALYPRLLWALKPRTIIEVGSKSGGSALWFGDLLNNFDIHGHVYSLDIVPIENLAHPRVTFLEANGRALEQTLDPGFLECLPRPWLVIEDADHAYETSSAVLKFFHPWLQPGEYIVVEDGIISDLAQLAECHSGPHWAIREFLGQHPGEYEIDPEYCDFFGYNATWCTNGWLRKTGAAATPPPDAELAEAEALLAAGQPDRALARLSRVKSLRSPARGADYLRARCFVQQQRPGEAAEALREELRLHPDHAAAADLLRQLTGGKTALPLPDDPEFRELFAAIGPYTMLSPERLYSLFTQARQVCVEDLPGNFVECGVAAGGSSALLAAVVARHSRRPRKVYACDSFEGLPNPGTLDRHGGVAAAALGWGGGTCAAPVESLLEICRRLKVEHLVEPVRGFFAQSLPRHREQIGPIALLHLDGDWYESTRSILENLYGQVVEGGRLQFDDYGHWEGCRRAVEEFQKKLGLAFALEPVDAAGVRLRKTAAA